MDADSILIWQQTNAAMVRFLSLEAEIGLNFAQAAMEASWTEDVLRNRQFARRAYETACRLLQRAKFTEAEAMDFMDKLARLHQFLRHLGDPDPISGVMDTARRANIEKG